MATFANAGLMNLDLAIMDDIEMAAITREYMANPLAKDWAVEISESSIINLDRYLDDYDPFTLFVRKAMHHRQAKVPSLQMSEDTRKLDKPAMASKHVFSGGPTAMQVEDAVVGAVIRGIRNDVGASIDALVALGPDGLNRAEGIAQTLLGRIKEARIGANATDEAEPLDEVRGNRKPTYSEKPETPAANKVVESIKALSKVLSVKETVHSPDGTVVVREYEGAPTELHELLFGS